MGGASPIPSETFDFIEAAYQKKEYVLAAGDRTRCLVFPRVEWRRRCYNTLAAMVAGPCLASQRNVDRHVGGCLEQMFKPDTFSLLQIHSDGAASTTSGKAAYAFTWTLCRLEGSMLQRKIHRIVVCILEKATAFESETHDLVAALSSVLEVHRRIQGGEREHGDKESLSL